MSNLRIIGIIIGCIGLFLSFRKYRGSEWNQSGFVILFCVSLSILTVSINPNILNIFIEIFSLQEVQRGRILFLVIGSIVTLFISDQMNKGQIIKNNRQLDLLIRKLSAGDSANITNNLKPIMILIPAYNEEDNLRILLNKIPKELNGVGVGVLVVDDGSSDSTYQVAIESGCLAVKNIINRGQGAASRLGYDLLCQVGVDIIVTMDGDNQHKPEDIQALIEPIKYNNYDFVIGSRHLGSHDSSDTIRNLGIHVLTFVINLITGQKLTDCSSGFKAFNVKKMDLINLEEDQFQSSEVIIEASKAGLLIKEVPITIIERSFGKSKKGSNVSYGFNFIKVMIKTWWRKV